MERYMGITKAYYQKGILLGKATLEELASSKGMGELILRLKGTVYSSYVSKLTTPYNSKDLELVFREHMIDLHHWLLTYSKDGILPSLYLKYIVSNLKTVMKGKVLERPEKDIVGNLDMHAEELVGRRDLIARAVAAEGLEGAMETLKGSGFEDVVEGAIASYRDTGNLYVIDLYLDHALYDRLNSAFKKVKDRRLRPLVAYDVDCYNVKVILRGKLWGLKDSEIESLLVFPGFEIKKKELKELSGMKLQDAYEWLEGTPYEEIVPEGKADEVHIAKLEDGFNLLGYRYANRVFVWEPFNPVVMVAIVKLKELEVRNLTTTAFGIEQSISPAEIREGLILLE